MTIHRTRTGSEPSGGAEPGRNIIQIGDIFVEYTGQIPTQADLDRYNTPIPPLPRQAPPVPSGVSIPALRAEVAALRQVLIDAGLLDP